MFGSRPRLAPRDAAGQAFPLVLALAVAVGCAALVAFQFGRVHVAKANAQSAADVVAVATARGLRADAARLAAEPPLEHERLRREAAAAAAGLARANGVRVRTVRWPVATWPPTTIEIEVVGRGPLGTEVPATARAGIVIGGDDLAASGWASGGGYAGPLVHRDGKPMCPAVAAAFDRMDAAARRAGVDLVVNSGFRSDAEQAELFRRHPDPKWVAPPGRSRHRDATELDIDLNGSGGTWGWLADHAGEFGFLQRYSWEPWHYGYLPGCGADAAIRAGAIPDAALPAWVPSEYRRAIVTAATAHELDPIVLAALLRAESGFNPRAISPVGARGIAQFMPATARGIGLADPFDPAQAIPAAARLLSGHLRAFGSLALALAAYNAGPSAVARYGGVPPYRETQGYVARILAITGDLGPAPAGGGGVVLLRVEGALV